MVLNDISHLENCDAKALESMLKPVKRTLNSSMHYKTALMLSAQNIKHLNKIDELATECVMLNLEDGVSDELKPVALRLCAYFLTQLPQSDKKLVVRVNPLDEGGAEEIAFLNRFMPDAIRIPKIKNSTDVEKALELIDDAIEIHLSIETKEAWLNLASLSISPRVKAYYLGVLDLFADLKLPQSLLMLENPLLSYMLSHFLMTTHACGVKPVSFVYQNFRDIEGFQAVVEFEKLLGFNAKGCISPKQVDIANETFGYSEAELDRARIIVQLFEEKSAQGVSGFVDEVYGFIDEPIYKGARAILGID